MKLYGSYTSPFVRHVRIVLLETGLACEFIETDQTGSTAKSPTQRVPFLEDGDIFLTDSTSIIKHLRERVGQEYCKTAKELDELCLVNTVMDTCVNLFFIKRDGVDISAIPYLQRQAARIQSTLAELNQQQWPTSAPYNDAQIRLACFIGWAKLRKQVDFSLYPNLDAFFTYANQHPHFQATQPPQS
ncbi:glutathione S-transferase family protein [Cellvibrio sp. OA-2007]|uniref:glutathione S-transferase family protein n=1 Tax=Cellvibrio sp. OA-2007 TaxID=529823 RepID=UPI00078051A1|nr:glutathione S-transferase [Cellvibrio sp. OA-2007]